VLAAVTSAQPEPGRHEGKIPRPQGRLAAWVTAVPLIAVFLSLGLVGVYRYLNGFWLYRGFRPPRDPAYVRIHGTTQMISVESPALGGRRQLCAEPLLRAASARFAAFGSGARLARTF